MEDKKQVPTRISVPRPRMIASKKVCQLDMNTLKNLATPIAREDTDTFFDRIWGTRDENSMKTPAINVKRLGSQKKSAHTKAAKRFFNQFRENCEEDTNSEAGDESKKSESNSKFTRMITSRQVIKQQGTCGRSKSVTEDSSCTITGKAPEANKNGVELEIEGGVDDLREKKKYFYENFDLKSVMELKSSKEVIESSKKMSTTSGDLRKHSQEKNYGKFLLNSPNIDIFPCSVGKSTKILQHQNVNVPFASNFEGWSPKGGDVTLGNFVPRKWGKSNGESFLKHCAPDDASISSKLSPDTVEDRNCTNVLLEMKSSPTLHGDAEDFFAL
uniref:Uncharacterized protein n=1 Tax=Bracon brevicornis TaxID=1563983 RepID=A0A6V7HYH6_9HYME